MSKIYIEDIAAITELCLEKAGQEQNQLGKVINNQARHIRELKVKECLPDKR